jgi:hypothetical protein
MPSITLSKYECSRDLLPDVCAVCGAPATTRKSRTFSWHPSWVWILILVNLLVVLIVALVLTKRMTVRLPVCDQHEGYWRRRTLFYTLPTVFILLLGAGAFTYVVSRPPGPADDLNGWLCGGSIGLLFVWVVVAAIVQASGIRSTEITDRTMTLAGLHPDFVAAVREDRARDRDDARYRRTRYGDERDDFDDEWEGPPPRRRARDDWDEEEDDYDRRPRRRD